MAFSLRTCENITIKMVFKNVSFYDFVCVIQDIQIDKYTCSNEIETRDVYTFANKITKEMCANEAADSHSMWNNIFELACQHGLISHFFQCSSTKRRNFFAISFICYVFFCSWSGWERITKKRAYTHIHTESPKSTTFINVWIDWNNSNCAAHNKWYKICYNLFDLCFMAFSYPKYTYCMHCITAQRCKTGPNTKRPRKKNTQQLCGMHEMNALLGENVFCRLFIRLTHNVSSI